MTALRKLVWVACWAWLLSSYSASINAVTPDPTTGNLVNFTGTPTATTGNWVNGVYVNQLCFQAGQPGNCGPYPSVNQSGSINFSYGGVNLYQVVNIEQALKAAGSNLQVTGFNFGFAAKNGNGWDDGRQDYLNAYVQFYRPDGGLAATYGYGQYTNRLYNWTNFNFSETFANPSLATSYRAAQYGFIGRDNNYWAGNYGPEINNVSFNLKYRVDPCATDPTSSPACPGYAAAMSAKNPTAAPTMTVTAAPAVETVVVNTTTPIPTVSTASKTQVDAPTIKPPSKTVAAALSLIARNQQQTQALQTTVAQAAVAEAASAATAAQQQAVAVAAGSAAMSQTLSNATVQTQRQSTTPIAAPATSQTVLAPPAPNTAMANNENKSGTAASTTVQMPTPRAATPVTANATVVATVANVDTQQFSIPSLQSYFSRSQSASTYTVQDTTNTPALPPQPNKSATTAPVTTVVPVTVTTTNTAVFSQANTDYQQTAMVTAYTQPQNTMFYAMAAAPVEQQQQATAQQVSFARQAEVEQVSSTAGFMTNRTDPLNEVVESKPVVATTNTTESAQTVKPAVSDNELAGGVDISRLATTPAGYSNYTSLMLQDGKMYEPKEIYKNQKPVDNARALRQLSTDRLHQQMIEQQYRR
jgi:hypothetical protein